MDLKAKWGVAIQALARRAFEMEIISERQYHYLFEQIGRRGWKIKEPVALPIEKPRGLRKMAEIAYGAPLDYRRLAQTLCLPYALTKELSKRTLDCRPPLNRLDRGRYLTLRFRMLLLPTGASGLLSDANALFACQLFGASLATFRGT